MSYGILNMTSLSGRSEGWLLVCVQHLVSFIDDFGLICVRGHLENSQVMGTCFSVLLPKLTDHQHSYMAGLRWLIADFGYSCPWNYKLFSWYCLSPLLVSKLVLLPPHLNQKICLFPESTQRLLFSSVMDSTPHFLIPVPTQKGPVVKSYLSIFICSLS